MNLHMYCWAYRPKFVAIAQAPTVADARRLALEQIGECSETLSPEHAKARKFVETVTPEIWYGPNAEFVLTDSASLIEADAQNERRRKLLEQHGIKDPG